ncbi:MAG: hypothetical protein K0R90_515 [Oscillospiraceae bacterium]|jgi:uncharacterized membrane protein YqgA involved in biofilm formation|nr:hypothetical protein [Oscillospiraceae bacterium]
MILLGTIVNTVAIFVCGLLGLLFRKGIKENYSDIVMNAVGLCVILIGIIGAIKTKELVLLILSLVLGSLLGEFLKIEQNLNRLGLFIEKKTKGKEGSFSKGFVTSSLLFCVGSMAIVGSIESGLSNNHQTLFAKSTLDGITSLVFSSVMGVGVLFSGVMVFLYQGLITIFASFAKDFLTEDMIREISAVGGVLIMAIGLDMTGIKKLKVGNMLPALLIPIIYFYLVPIVYPMIKQVFSA